MSALSSLGAREQRRLVVTCEASPVELLDACIARIEQCNPDINAVVATDFDGARRDALAAESRARAGDAALSPLLGLPVLVKDLADTRGLRTTYGSRCFADHVPAGDAIVVERLRRAGAVIVGKTNTPEFGAGANTFNDVYGATRNPFRLDATSGGSSGGSAAALACAMAPLATGSDLGGSLRIPASFCSVVGMRPTPGVVPSASHVAGFSPLWTDGPMARNVADAALMLEAIAGYDRRDPNAAPGTGVSAERAGEETDLSTLRVGFSTDLGVALVDREIALVFEERRRTMASYFGGAHAPAIDLSAAAEAFRVLRASSLYAAYGPLAETRSHLLGDNVRTNLRAAEQLSLAAVARADAAQTRLFREFQALFDEIDVLVCPATAVSPFAVEEPHPIEINGEALEEYYTWYALTWALSLTASPVVSLPCGADHRGMPFGVQVVGPRWSDAKVLSIAAALEAALASDGIGPLTLRC